ncbi:hypothetical protein [Candidatus Solirubrobacter pratensis]|uniref:hypothetical protein n=1 Tax=Candidatus Solirubrobacter pratensis TaxID=1298857 RepID=UPI000429D7BF|nr:hypothetical protein [Candidatus Solirubrobacter pratensis]
MTLRRSLSAALLSGAVLLLPTAAAHADVLSAGGDGLAPDGSASPAQPLGSPGGIQPAELEPPAVTALSDGFLAGWAASRCSRRTPGRARASAHPCAWAR